MQYINPYIESCLESSASFLRGLSLKDKELIVQHHSISKIKKGGFLFREGEKAHGLVYLVSGKAKVFRAGVAGREHIIKMLKDKEFIGFQLLFGDSIWTASGVAIEESQICIIEKNSLLRILRNNAEISLKISSLLALELNFSYDKMVSLTQKHVRGRLVESLLMLADIYGYEADGKTINVCLSRNDIAHLSNMTTSNAIRTLSNLADEGKILVKGRKITILNFPDLRRISEQA